MSMDVFSGALGGLSEAFQQHNQNLLQQEIQRRQMLAAFWQKQSEDPSVRPEARDVATKKFMGIVQTPYEKKLPKQLEAMDDFLMVTPEAGKTLPPQGASQTVPAPSPLPLPAGIGAGVSSESMTVPAPTPPPGMQLPARFSRAEMLQMAKEQGGVEAETAGAKSYAEEAGKTKALYSPDNLAALIKIEEAKKPLTTIPAGGVAIRSSTGEVVARGEPRERSAEQKQLDAAAMVVAQRHNLTARPDAGSVFDQLPTGSLKAEAMQELAMMKEAPDIAEIRKLTQQKDRLTMRETQLRIDDLLKENDPVALGKVADLVHDNPDALFNYSPKEVAKVSQAMLAKGYPVPRKPLPAAQQTQESNAQLVVRHVAAIRGIVQQYPDIVGPVMGRVGLTEESWGAPIFSAKDNPDKAIAEQELRTRLKYLIAQDLRALIGARPPAQWIEELKSASPHITQAIPFLEGSLRGVEGSANLVLDAAYRERYGTQATATGRGTGTVAPPTPPPGTAPATPAAAARPRAATTPAPAAKTATMMDVRAYAETNHISEAAAISAFEQDGFRVIGAVRATRR